MILLCAAGHQAQQSSSVNTDEKKAQEVLHDKTYSFADLLNKDSGAIANSKRIFALTTDAEHKQRIASILMSLGIKDRIYFDYLRAAASDALASPVPWPSDNDISLTKAEVPVIKLLWAFRGSATVQQLADAPENETRLSRNSISATITALEAKGYVKHLKEGETDTYQSLVGIYEPPPGTTTNTVQAYSFNPAFIAWCKEHPEKPWDQWYREAVYPDPDPWYYFAAAGDPRSYDLLLQGLHSRNVGIAMLAAKGLAKLQDPRAIDEIIAVSRHASFGAGPFIAEYLLYFHDLQAQAAADELIPDKHRLQIARNSAEKKGVRGLFPW
jgi:predicted transcriptional regulator